MEKTSDSQKKPKNISTDLKCASILPAKNNGVKINSVVTYISASSEDTA
ncbi:hypothetical protein K0U27_11095 [archaeon]|nr:hypothetical protein [archaeon]